MPLVYRHIDYVNVAQVQSWLASQGIATELRNYNISSLTGEIPQGNAAGELWVADDVDVTRVEELLTELRNAPLESGPDWTCAACGEAVPASLGECWKCGRLAPERSA